MVIEDRPEGKIKPKEDQRPEKRKFRVRLLIFLVCLCISASMWVFIELMKDYTTDVEYAMAFRNVPEDLILVNQADSTIHVGVNAQGFELLVAGFMKKKQTIELDLSDIRIRQDASGYSAYMPASRILEQVGMQLKYAKAITYIRPDTLFFRFSEIYRKRVPVVLDLDYSFESQYNLADTIRYSPMFVTVSSIKDVIDTLRFIKTEHLSLHGLDSSRTVSIPLHKSLRSSMIRYSSDTVRTSIRVKKFTEAVFSIPVSVSGNILPIKIFPEQVEVVCMVPMDEYSDLDASGFAATVIATPANLSAYRKLKVMLTRQPQNVRSVRIRPDEVEFIVITK